MNTKDFIEKQEKKAAGIFRRIDEIALFNQEKTLDAFKECRIEARHMQGSSGYGYDDAGKTALNAVFAKVFKTESAIVSPMIASGTHAIGLCLYGVLRPGDTLLSISGAPYDTLYETINGSGTGSLKDFNINFKEIALKNSGFDKAKILRALKDGKIKVVYIQRSRGYAWRPALSIAQMREIISEIRKVRPEICVAVDNCYGEFTDREEPSEVGADVVMGSLIKNPGGGLAPCGGYIAGKKEYINLIANRLTVPGIGAEVGSYAPGYRAFFQGLFIAPHVTAQSLKGSVLAGLCMEALGYETSPDTKKMPLDIIRAVKFNNEKDLVEFCKNIQYNSPVDSFVTPEAWAMPGYADKVIMAAGAFVQGASIELSCDAPIRPPYIAYLQGSLTYEHIKIVLNRIIANLHLAN